MIGRLNASHHATNRAALRDASMSSVPARCIGWFATMPTARPSSVRSRSRGSARSAARSSRSESASSTSSTTIAHVVRRGRAFRDRRGGDRRTAAIGRRRRSRARRIGEVVVGEIRQSSATSASRATTSSRDDERGDAGAAVVHRRCRRARSRDTRTPVKSSTESGPVTNANASSVITTWSNRPSASAGPETHAPVTASSVGTTPETAHELAGQAAPRVQRGDAFAELRARRVELADERDLQLARRAAPRARRSRCR